MTDKPRPSSSDIPPPDLTAERDQVLRHFARGAALTREFADQYEHLVAQVRSLEAENARLRSILEADDAIRTLVSKIDVLENEKKALLSRFEAAEAASSDVSKHFNELESELSNFANLHVATNCIHSTLSPRGVGRRIKEILEQLVGVEAYAIYLCTSADGELTPIAFEGVDPSQRDAEEAPRDRLRDVVKTGAASIDDDADPSKGTLSNPPALIPLTIDDRVVGVLAVVRSLAHKTKLSTVDFELFQLLGQHAAAALMGCGLYAQAGRALPTPDAFADLNR